MDWRNGSTTEIYRRRRPPMGAIPNAAWRLVLLQSGSRIIAALLAWAPFMGAPSRKAAEYEDGG
jgi:hypothetical protein